MWLKVEFGDRIIASAHQTLLNMNKKALSGNPCGFSHHFPATQLATREKSRESNLPSPAGSVLVNKHAKWVCLKIENLQILWPSRRVVATSAAVLGYIAQAGLLPNE